MQTIGILLLVVGALGLFIAAIGKLLMAWPAAGKTGGISLGVAIVGAILWAAAPAGAPAEKAGPEVVPPSQRVQAPRLSQPRPFPPPPPPRLPPPPPPPPAH